MFKSFLILVTIELNKFQKMIERAKLIILNVILILNFR